MTELLRIASGPNRAPALKVTPVSKGTPITAKSASSAVVKWGSLMNVLIPQNLGDSKESVGLYFFIFHLLLIFGRLAQQSYPYTKQQLLDKARSIFIGWHATEFLIRTCFSREKLY